MYKIKARLDGRLELYHVVTKEVLLIDRSYFVLVAYQKQLEADHGRQS